MTHCVKILRSVAFSLVKIYQRGFSPLLHFFTHMFGLPFQCKYPVSCSEYALSELKGSASLAGAIQRILKRLISCGPWQGALVESTQQKVR